MAYNITGFILDSYRFSFLSRVNRPLTKFSINNAIIPLAFIIFYIIYFVRFQLTYEYNTAPFVFLKMVGFLAGVSGVIFLFYLYFRITNKDVFYVWARDVDKKLRTTQMNRVNVMIKLNTVRSSAIRIDSYINSDLKIKRIDNFLSYDKEKITRVFDYYQLNAVIIEVLILISILIFGFFREVHIFQIPAAASAILVMNIFIMVTGALTHWFRKWSITIVILVFFIFNNLVKYEWISSRNEAYGVNYDTIKTEFSLKKINELSNQKFYEADKISTLKILENWRRKFPEGKKPKMILLCVSGGGQRAALWTMNTMQKVDQELDGQLFKNTVLITGASGGLVGASYFRELYLRSRTSDSINIYDEQYLDDISKDILNPVVLSMAISNPVMSFQKFEYQGFEYQKDRGYAFELQLNKNTNHFLEKPLSAYKEPEQKALIPMMMLSPTIINDGRRLYISPQKVSYMNTAPHKNELLVEQKIKGIEFSRFFKDQNGEHIRFTSALRMSATFPYVTPNILLPSSPEMEIMDAGLADNFGVIDAVKFMYVFQEWIKRNTSGVILVMIRDTEINKEISRNEKRSFVQEFISPIGGLYKNWDNIQDINNDNLIGYAHAWLGNVKQVDFEYTVETERLKIPGDPQSDTLKTNGSESKASLSWRLTTREKESIKSSINSHHNKEALNKLKFLLNSRIGK